MPETEPDTWIVMLTHAISSVEQPCVLAPSTKASSPFAPMYWSSRRRPLDHHIEVTGPASVADTDFTQKLIDVYPPSAGLSHGFARSRSPICSVGSSSNFLISTST
jgi:hypothetical protein